MAVLNKLECSCGCGIKPAEKALHTLEAVNAQYRLKTGNELVVTSGARCPDHNKKIGGAEKSAHTKGLAFDVATPNSQARYYVLNILFAAGIKRIGINFAKNFIHFDIDDTLPNPVVFKY
jgi:uncharacterized protein YcbK (DUF882 family)